MGDPSTDNPEACFRRALELARATQARALELRAATSLARALRETKRAGEARRILDGVCESLEGKGASADLIEARALLAELRG